MIAYRVQYTFTRVHARIPNGQPREDPRAEVSEDVRVGVAVGPMEFKLNSFSTQCQRHGPDWTTAVAVLRGTGSPQS